LPPHSGGSNSGTYRIFRVARANSDADHHDRILASSRPRGGDTAFVGARFIAPALRRWRATSKAGAMNRAATQASTNTSRPPYSGNSNSSAIAIASSRPRCGDSALV